MLRKRVPKSQRRFFTTLVLALLLLVAVLSLSHRLRSSIEPTAYAATLTVTTADDHNDGTCNADCTLREAINAANAGAGGDTISFNIPGVGVHTINATIGGFSITKAVTIDGTTQPGFTGAPLIELNGALADGNAGLTIHAQNVTV